MAAPSHRSLGRYFGCNPKDEGSIPSGESTRSTPMVGTPPSKRSGGSSSLSERANVPFVYMARTPPSQGGNTSSTLVGDTKTRQHNGLCNWLRTRRLGVRIPLGSLLLVDAQWKSAALRRQRMLVRVQPARPQGWKQRSLPRLITLVLSDRWVRLPPLQPQRASEARGSHTPGVESSTLSVATGVSSNGRTEVFEASDHGSNPCAPTGS